MEASATPPVACVQIGALVDLAQQRGIAPEVLLQRPLGVAGVTRERVTVAEFQRLLERAVGLTGQAGLALECGLQASEASFGLMSALVSHTRTLRHAIELIVQFHALLLDDVRIRLDERLDEARVCCVFAQPAVDPGMSELVVAGLVRTLRSFGCAPSELRAVCFEHARPAHHAAYTRAFGGAERFGQRFTGVEFARALLDRPHLHQQPELELLLREQAERGLKSLARPEACGERVRALLLRHHAELDMEQAARELGMSVRSLRRRLLDEGTSFRALSAEVLRESACALLRDPALTLQAIALRLGFADAETFHHTFKRWTQQTPSEYRQAQ